MSLILNESLVLAKTRSQDLKSVLKLNCWGSGIKDVSLVRQLINVEVIGLSSNEITTLEDFAHCHKLKELILRKNKVKNISEIAHLQALPNLQNLWLEDNPCATNTYNYRKVVLKALPQLKTLDNKPVTREELQEIEELGNEIYEEIPYESTGSSACSMPPPNRSSNTAASQNHHSVGEVPNEHQNSGEAIDIHQQTPLSAATQHQQNDSEQQSQQFPASNYQEQQSINETSYYQPLNDTTTLETSAVNQSTAMNDSAMLNRSRSIQLQHSRGSMGALNCSQTAPTWSTNNNNHINALPKGGKSRGNGNILSAVLCLVNELDYVSCEVVRTALHCRMEETSQ